mmetsp:Transcript_47976/g.148206  ORF Transcript_47976/g.148206 Transcript_47976/m.148206 type:complete len:223 (+) Transcript_47976:851-1519(+)
MPISAAASRSTRSKPAQRRRMSFTPSALKISMTSRPASSLTKRQTASDPAHRRAVCAVHSALMSLDSGNLATRAPICPRTYSETEKMATFTEVFTSPSYSGTGLHMTLRMLSLCKFASRSKPVNSSLTTDILRFSFGFAGSEDCPVAFTSLVSSEPAMYCSALVMVVPRMLFSASCVRKALWGVMRTFGKERSRENCWSHFSRRLLSSILSKSLKKRPASFS